jgi:hypothetical protein
MNALKISYDGEEKNLVDIVTKYQEILQNTLYDKDLSFIKDVILKDFNSYKQYSLIFLRNIVIRNNSNLSSGVFYLNSNKTLTYPTIGGIFTKVLLLLLFLFVILVIILSIYCYINNINCYDYLFNDLMCF